MKSFLADKGDVTFILSDFGSTDFVLVVFSLLIAMLEATVLTQTVGSFLTFSKLAEGNFRATGMKAGELGDDSNLLGTVVVAYEFEFRTETIGLLCVVFTTSGVKVQDAVEFV
jgi:hypothetical protein